MNYSEQIKKEINRYKKVTDVHQLPASHGYWGSRYLRTKINAMGYNDIHDVFVKFVSRANDNIDGPLNIVSIGAGNCDYEIGFAKRLLANKISNFQITCLDINPHMLERGRSLAASQSLEQYIDTYEVDFNKWQSNKTLHIVIANQSLHHVLELEHLFDAVRESLHPKGYFLINDMIGRNGHQKWPEAELLIRLIWNALDEKYRHNVTEDKIYEQFPNRDCSGQGFEGIRAQDILPLLCERFSFPFFIPFKSLISPFISRGFGHNFHTDVPEDMAFINSIATLDEKLIEGGILTPTQMYGVLSAGTCDAPIWYNDLPPKFFIRNPDSPPPFEIPELLSKFFGFGE